MTWYVSHSDAQNAMMLQFIKIIFSTIVEINYKSFICLILVCCSYVRICMEDE